jgi:hypothetical protein
MLVQYHGSSPLPPSYPRCIPFEFFLRMPTVPGAPPSIPFHCLQYQEFLHTLRSQVPHLGGDSERPTEEEVLGIDSK